MKTINYRCDYCGVEKEVDVKGGFQIPRLLWQIGHQEVCDECLKAAQDYLQHKYADK